MPSGAIRVMVPASVKAGTTITSILTGRKIAQDIVFDAKVHGDNAMPPTVRLPDRWIQRRLFRVNGLGLIIDPAIRVPIVAIRGVMLTT